MDDNGTECDHDDGGGDLVGGEPVHQLPLPIVPHTLHEKHHLLFLFVLFPRFLVFYHFSTQGGQSFYCTHFAGCPWVPSPAKESFVCFGFVFVHAVAATDGGGDTNPMLTLEQFATLH